MVHHFPCEDPIFSDVKRAKEKGWARYSSGMSALTQVCSLGLKPSSWSPFMYKIELSWGNMTPLEGLFQLKGESTLARHLLLLFTAPPPDAAISFLLATMWENTSWRDKGQRRGGLKHTNTNNKTEKEGVIWSRKAGWAVIVSFWPLQVRAWYSIQSRCSDRMCASHCCEHRDY